MTLLKSLQKMIDDFSSVYAVTDEKFSENEFNKKVKKKIKLKQKVSKLVIYFILVINTLNH